jgi:DNA-binding XRE family transcriptional regulator
MKKKELKRSIMEDEMSEYYEHNTHGAYCWCNPKIEVMENGNKVIIHNDIKPEEATEMGNILLAIASENSTASLFKAIRKIRKLSMSDVSEISGVNRNTIGSIENGNTIMTARLKTLCAISRALKCDLRIELVPYEKFTQEVKHA